MGGERKCSDLTCLNLGFAACELFVLEQVTQCLWAYVTIYISPDRVQW